ncbi:reverse transcriptase [Cucumis melo var. makuwa]|uniref:Reverse transcriptase n=1 Tax=Cucumis melo var. makuwa TaxID=1194695 RepID=A0A5A7TWY0_CUCMM|nr:reverse transcriptase [Cucumis melo var. makuwa]
MAQPEAEDAPDVVTAFRAHMVEVHREKLKLKDFPIVKEFLDVFLDDLSNFSLDEEVEFTIELLPGTIPISQTPYKMASSKLKITKGYHQSKVKELDIPKTAFRTRIFHQYLYQFMILFIDDILVYSVFLGHVALANEFSVDPQKVEAIVNWERSTNEIEVCSFLGIEERLVTTPILALRITGKDYVIYCNTSRQGLGCVHMQDGKLRHSKAVVTTEDSRSLLAQFLVRSSLVAEIVRRQLEDSNLHKKLRKSKEGLEGEFHLRTGSTKMYRTLKKTYWWPRMKQEIAKYVDRCLIYQQVKPVRQRPRGLLTPLLVPKWKLEHIAMDFLS